MMQRVQWRRVIQLKAPPPWHIRVLSSVPGKVILCLNVVKIFGRPICAVNAEKFVFVRIFGVCALQCTHLSPISSISRVY